MKGEGGHSDGAGGGLIGIIVGALGLLIGKWLEQRNARKQEELKAKIAAAQAEQSAEDAFEDRALKDWQATREHLASADKANRELWAENQELHRTLAECRRTLDTAQEKQAQVERSLWSAEARVMALGTDLERERAQMAADRSELEFARVQIRTLAEQVAALTRQVIYLKQECERLKEAQEP